MGKCVHIMWDMAGCSLMVNDCGQTTGQYSFIIQGTTECEFITTAIYALYMDIYNSYMHICIQKYNSAIYKHIHIVDTGVRMFMGYNAYQNRCFTVF